ncbi:undecaprenyl-diphosphatase [Enterobacter sp. CC120223-11]|uniref:undecaprenyl-diphosphatase n=1 Tax=Enterobacter sp. CC120223-11 TaxID=1378073 RepID=UPI001596C9AE
MPAPLALNIVRAMAELPLWLLPLTTVWLWRKKENRLLVMTAVLSAAFALLINVTIGHVWPTPRPFVVGIGNTLVAHSASASFPSDHAVLIWAFAFTLMMTARLRTAGAWLFTAGLAVAWARVYLGLHFPVDMLGAFVVALVSAWIMTRMQIVQLLTSARKKV